jgi:hypothetical protein
MSEQLEPSGINLPDITETDESNLAKEVAQLHTQVFQGIREVSQLIANENADIIRDPSGFEIRLYPSTVNADILRQSITNGTIINGEIYRSLQEEPAYNMSNAHALDISYNAKKDTFYLRIGKSVQEQLVDENLLPPRHRIHPEIRTHLGLNTTTLEMKFQVDGYVRREHNGFQNITVTSTQKVDGIPSGKTVRTVGEDGISDRVKMDTNLPNNPKAALLSIVAKDLQVVSTFLNNKDKMHIFGLSAGARFSEIDGRIAEMFGGKPVIPTAPQVVFINRDKQKGSLQTQSLPKNK